MTAWQVVALGTVAIACVTLPVIEWLARRFWRREP
jgi:hypothetical protein